MRKIWNAARTSTIALMFVLFLAIGMRAEAAPGQVTGVKQTAAGTNSVSITFQALVDTEVRYEIQLSSSANGTFQEWSTCSKGEDYIYNLPNAGSSYYLRVVPYTRNGIKKEYGPSSEVIEVVTAPSTKPENLKHTTSTETSITLAWNSVAGANGYQIKYKNNQASGYMESFVTGNQAVLSSLTSNTEYNVEVYPVRKSAAGFNAVGRSYGTLYNIPVVPGKGGKPDCVAYWKNLGEIRADAVTMKSADGYQWEIWTAYQKKGKRLKTQTQTSNAAFIKYKGFKNYNFFKMRTRAYCTNSDGKKIAGSWSDWTYFCPQPEVIKLQSVKSGISVTWNTIKGADKYEVYISSKAKSGFKKCAATQKTTATIKKFGKSSLKSGRKYYFYVTAYNKVGKKLYSGMAGNATVSWSITYKKQ